MLRRILSQEQAPGTWSMRIYNTSKEVIRKSCFYQPGVKERPKGPRRSFIHGVHSRRAILLSLERFLSEFTTASR